MTFFRSTETFLGRFDPRIDLLSYRNEIHSGKLTCYDMLNDGYNHPIANVSWHLEQGKEEGLVVGQHTRSGRKVKKLNQQSINSVTVAVDAVVVQQALLNAVVRA